MLVAGATAGTASFAVNLVALPVQPALYSPGIIIAMLWIAIISGIVLGGLVCKILGDRLLAIASVRQFLGTQVS
jgi:ABC-type thiamin/hydroxymethylpyrimidine transport system permease subunit